MVSSLYNIGPLTRKNNSLVKFPIVPILQVELSSLDIELSIVL